MVRASPTLDRLLRDGKSLEHHAEFKGRLDSFLQEYGAISRAVAEDPPPPEARKSIVGLTLEMAGRKQEKKRPGPRDRDKMATRFLSKFEGDRAEFARSLLDLARASYRWRDDDNIHLARIEAEFARAVDCGRQRLAARSGRDLAWIEPGEIATGLRNPDHRLERRQPAKADPEQTRRQGVIPRQLTGLPAGPGIGTGPARVISGTDDLFGFKSGEVLVCAAIEPEMTLVVPLAAGIVERRGGMLIHGAIVAREYGIPCVTGVPRAAQLIESGDMVTVDGYLGIVVIDSGRGIEGLNEDDSKPVGR
jgi:pyruvate,water dikinase